MPRVDFVNPLTQSIKSLLPSIGAHALKRLDQLGDLMADQVQKDANVDPMTMFMALESVLRSLVTDMGSPKDIGELARFLRDHPDHFLAPSCPLSLPMP